MESPDMQPTGTDYALHAADNNQKRIAELEHVVLILLGVLYMGTAVGKNLTDEQEKVLDAFIFRRASS